jgi:hypothetical protein
MAPVGRTFSNVAILVVAEDVWVHHGIGFSFSVVSTGPNRFADRNSGVITILTAELPPTGGNGASGA